MSSPKRRWNDQRVLALTQSQGATDPEVAIKALCSTLIDETGLKEPPFKPEILASFRGVVTVTREPMKEAARLIPLASGFKIEVNAAHVTEKQNFSIDHEVCHTFFVEFGSSGPFVDQETGTFNVKNEEEYLCDIGASALLFDPRWFRSEASSLDASSSTIFALAKTFGGSLEATSRAWCDLDLCPCAVVFWEEGFKPTQSSLRYQVPLQGFDGIREELLALRVRLAWHSDTFKNLHFFPRDKSADKDGPICACLRSQASTDGCIDLDTRSGSLRVRTQNAYVPYRKDGMLGPRVMTVVTLDANG